MGVTSERRTVGGKTRLQIKGCFVVALLLISLREDGAAQRGNTQCSEKSLVLEYVSESNCKGA